MNEVREKAENETREHLGNNYPQIHLRRKGSHRLESGAIAGFVMVETSV